MNKESSEEDSPMETLLKSEQALDILTTISLAQFLIIVLILGSAIFFVYKFRGSIKQFLENYRQEENKKQEFLLKVDGYEAKIVSLEKHHQEDMDEMYKKQLAYRQQSLNKQANIDKQFSELVEKIEMLTEMLNVQHEEQTRMKRNELREKLLNSYRHYTSLEQNPEQVWNEMEAEAFWHLFSDYEQLNGNGFMHSTVKPAMQQLTVTKIS